MHQSNNILKILNINTKSLFFAGFQLHGSKLDKIKME